MIEFSYKSVTVTAHPVMLKHELLWVTQG